MARGVLALAAALIAYCALSFSVAHVLVRLDPERAHRLAPFDGRITARLSAALAAPTAKAEDRRRSSELAKLALRQNATGVAAASALGVNEQFRGDVGSARKIFTYAERLSRRDLVTQLWAIEDSVTRGDVKGALRHYDIALRTKTEISNLLFPILAKAIDDPAIRSELIATLAARPLWGEAFVSYAGDRTPDPWSAAQLFAGMRRAGIPVANAAQAGAVKALVAKERFGQAWTYYRSVRPGVDRQKSRDPRFSAADEPPTPFDWTPMGEDGVITSLKEGLFDFSAPASVGGPLLQQVQMLPPGTYRMRGRSEDLVQARDALPYWVLTCRDGRELARVDVPSSSQAGGQFAGTFQVPANCPVQTLTLVARPSEAVGGLSGRIAWAELAPVG